MANELRGTFNLLASDSVTSLNTPWVKAITVDMTEKKTAGTMPTVTSTASTIPTSGLTNVGYVLLRNNDPTNGASWGYDNSGSYVEMGKLKPKGLPTLIYYTTGKTYQIKADSTSVVVEVLAFGA